jgi:hypothetical protein
MPHNHRMKRVSKNSKLIALIVEDWRRPRLSLESLKACFNGQGVNILSAGFVTMDQAKQIAAKK